MNRFFESGIEYLEGLPKAKATVIFFCLMIVVAVADLFTGPDIAFAAIYLIPIAFAAWFGGRTLGVWASVLCMASFMLNYVIWSSPPHVIITNARVGIINVFMDGMVFLAFCWLVSALHNQVRNLTEMVRERTAALESEVHDRRSAQEELSKLNEQLEQRVAERTVQLQAAVKELEAFSYSVSHDLRGPLRGINGFTQEVLDHHSEQLDEVGRADLLRIRAGSERMGELINDLLDLSRYSRSDLHRRSVNLEEIASNILDDLQANEPGRRITTVVTHGLAAEADPKLIRVVLENLLGNAWKFTRKQPAARIEFGAIPRSEGLVYFVRDNGAGFDSRYVGTLFQPFRRLHTNEEFEGTGIGLSIVARIIQRHGGRVWAESALGKGSVFYFTLPPTTIAALR